MTRKWQDIKVHTIRLTRPQLIHAVGKALYGWGPTEPNEATGFIAVHESTAIADAILTLGGEPSDV